MFCWKYFHWFFLFIFLSSFDETCVVESRLINYVKISRLICIVLSLHVNSSTVSFIFLMRLLLSIKTSFVFLTFMETKWWVKAFVTQSCRSTTLATVSDQRYWLCYYQQLLLSWYDASEFKLIALLPAIFLDHTLNYLCGYAEVTATIVLGYKECFKSIILLLILWQWMLEMKLKFCYKLWHYFIVIDIKCKHRNWINFTDSDWTWATVIEL